MKIRQTKSRKIVIKSSFPKQMEFKYLAVLRRLLKAWHQLLLEQVESNLPYILNNDDSTNNDDWHDRLQLLINAVTIYQGTLVDSQRPSVLNIAMAIQQIQIRNFKKISNDVLGVGILGGESSRKLVYRWSSDNVKLITKMLDEEKQAISVIVGNAYSSGLSNKQATSKIKEQFKVSDNKAKLIARNEIGNLAGQFQKVLSEENGLPIYEWLSSLDERVRKTHRAMHGKICRWDDATVYKDSVEDKVWKQRSLIGGVELHPAMDIRCRCTSASIVNF